MAVPPFSNFPQLEKSQQWPYRRPVTSLELLQLLLLFLQQLCGTFRSSHLGLAAVEHVLGEVMNLLSEGSSLSIYLSFYLSICLSIYL
jgi:hypothetical protein